MSPQISENELTSESGLTKLEHSGFLDTSKKIIKSVRILQNQVLNTGKLTDEDEPSMVTFVQQWVTKMVRDNIRGGKMLRGLMVPTAVKKLVLGKSPESSISNEQMNLAFILGWILEMLQSASLIADDVMDQSETRRGKPCWYKVPGVGLTAINDSQLLATLSFKILKMYFGKESYYRELETILYDIVHLTVQGQCLDILTESNDQNISARYTMERYDSVVKYKTSYYTIYMPVICALIMTGKASDAKLVHQAEIISLKIGHYFQVQDDFLDCFGDEEKTGKTGTDIQDNKCSWLFVKAVELCNDETELDILVNNYGKRETAHVDIVKKLYMEIGVKQAFQDYEDMTHEAVLQDLKNLPDDMPKELFQDMLDRLYKRKN